MIETLRIERLAVVESAEVHFGPGLNVLTGETGAGKSLVLGALSLLAGARASSDQVREGADEAVVEAVFRTGDLPELEAELAGRGLEVEEHELIVRRSISRSGRSRARIGGAQVPVSTLAELFQGRIEISSQHASQALLRPEVQGRLLDAHGGLLERRGEVEAGVRGLRELDREIADLRARAEERARREDFLAFQVREIEDAAVEPGELARLEQERGRLRHAEQLCAEAGLAARCLGGDPAAPETAGAADLLADAARRVEALAELDAGLGELAARLRGAHLEAAEACAELERYAEAIEADPARLAALEERLDRLERLRRKYGDDEDAILAFRDRAAAELAAVAGADARLGELEAERADRAKRVERAAAELSRGRRKAAVDMAEAVRAGLARLAMPEACFEVALEPVAAEEGLPCGGSGAEAAELRFSANPGEPPRALRRVASGGELSRVFLALKNVLRRAGAGTALVFDEVDAGVGGGVADRIGAVLAELAGAHQVLCITHLPQIAARADTHFRIAKTTRAGRTHASLERLDESARLDEVARMAGGETISEATRHHARALLDGNTQKSPKRKPTRKPASPRRPSASK